MSPALLVLHPRSRRHKSCDALLRTLAEDFSLDIQESCFAGHTCELVRHHLKTSTGLIFTAGGDGTLHEAINAWADSGFPDGVRFVPLPLGTGNDFLHSLDVRFSKPEHYLQHPLKRLEELDLGHLSYQHDGSVRSRYFCVGATAGFSALVTQRRARLANLIPGSMSYLLALLFSLASWKNREVRIESQECSFSSDIFFNFNAANVKYYGGGMISAPRASAFSGSLEAVSMNLTLGQVFRALPENFRGRFERVKNVRQVSLREPFSVECLPPCPVQADGELLGTTPMSLRCLPKKLPLLLPTDSRSNLEERSDS